MIAIAHVTYETAFLKPYYPFSAIVKYRYTCTKAWGNPINVSVNKRPSTIVTKLPRSQTESKKRRKKMRKERKETNVDGENDGDSEWNEAARHVATFPLWSTLSLVAASSL